MILYGYSADGVYTGPISPRLSPARPLKADGSPNYQIPARTTPTAPPVAGDGYSAVWSETNQTWALTQDNRGKVAYSTQTRAAIKITGLGPVPDGYTLSVPPGDSYTWDGSSWVLDIARARDMGRQRIDEAAELLRNTVVTAGSAQAMIYIEKERQARAYLAAESPVDSDYPNLIAEVGINGDTIKAVAETIVRYADAWRAWGALVEGVRLGTKKAISTALTPEEIDKIIAGVTWPATPAEVL